MPSIYIDVVLNTREVIDIVELPSIIGVQQTVTDVLWWVIDILDNKPQFKMGAALLNEQFERFYKDPKEIVPPGKYFYELSVSGSFEHLRQQMFPDIKTTSTSNMRVPAHIHLPKINHFIETCQNALNNSLLVPAASNKIQLCPIFKQKHRHHKKRTKGRRGCSMFKERLPTIYEDGSD